MERSIEHEYQMCDPKKLENLRANIVSLHRRVSLLEERKNELQDELDTARVICHLLKGQIYDELEHLWGSVDGIVFLLPKDVRRLIRGTTDGSTPALKVTSREI